MTKTCCWSPDGPPLASNASCVLPGLGSGRHGYERLCLVRASGARRDLLRALVSEYRVILETNVSRERTAACPARLHLGLTSQQTHDVPLPRPCRALHIWSQKPRVLPATVTGSPRPACLQEGGWRWSPACSLPSPSLLRLPLIINSNTPGSQRSTKRGCWVER